MIKNKNYFQEMDLARKATQLANLSIQQGESNDERSELLSDMIMAILTRCITERFTDLDLMRLLGSPARKEMFRGDAVWFYQWQGVHEDVRFNSETPIVLRNSLVIGVLANGEVLTMNV